MLPHTHDAAVIADLRARDAEEDSDEVDTAVDDNNNKRTLGVFFWNLWCPYSPFSGGHRRRSAPGRRMD